MPAALQPALKRRAIESALNPITESDGLGSVGRIAQTGMKQQAGNHLIECAAALGVAWI